MPPSNNLSQYDDVRDLLDTAIDRGYLKILFKTSGAANHWRLRANHYRKLLHDYYREKSLASEHETTTSYDNYVFMISAEEKTAVVIRRRAPAVALQDEEGNPVPLSPKKAQETMTLPNDEEAERLLKEALNLRKPS